MKFPTASYTVQVSAKNLQPTITSNSTSKSAKVKEKKKKKNMSYTSWPTMYS